MNGNVFGTIELFEESNKRRRLRELKEYLSSLTNIINYQFHLSSSNTGMSTSMISSNTSFTTNKTLKRFLLFTLLHSDFMF